ncbi:MAG: esterase [Chlamydiia bacterium]|nr:esterase [Chlamydiia bacterium]
MRGKILERKLGDLDALHVQGDPSGPYIILMHGFGANKHDLLGLHRMLPNHPEVNWVFPNGFLEVPLGMWMTGRAWFPVDMDAFAQEMWSDRQMSLTQTRPEGMDEAMEKLTGMVAALGVPASRIVFGGFSQGAAMAAELTLCSKETPAGLMIFSSMLIDEPKWQQHAPAHKGLHFFQSHGTADPLVALEPAQELHRMLTGSGLVGELYLFDGGHEIPPGVMSRTITYLEGRLAPLRHSTS